MLRQDNDNPEFDGTDAAHPAWWRGQKAGFDAAMRMIAKALTERPVGVISNERWQALREHVYAMANQRSDTPSSPDLAVRIVAAVEDNLKDRRGISWDNLGDDGLIQSMRDELARVVRDVLAEPAKEE